MNRLFQKSGIELVIPFFLGTAAFLWISGGPSFSAVVYMLYLAAFLVLMPSGRFAGAVYTLLFPLLPLAFYIPLAASSNLTLNSGFDPVFTRGMITPVGVWKIWSEYLVISLSATVVRLALLYLKDRYSIRDKA